MTRRMAILVAVVGLMVMAFAGSALAVVRVGNAGPNRLVGTAENDTLIGFDGTPWHSHGIVQFLAGDSTYIECDELEILVGLDTGELVIVSEYTAGQLSNRWLAHVREPLEFDEIKPGEELRVYRLPDRANVRIVSRDV